MSDSEKFAVATHLYVRLRRLAGRVIDPAWMARDERYARQILADVRLLEDSEMHRLAARYEELNGWKQTAPPVSLRERAPSTTPAAAPPVAPVAQPTTTAGPSPAQEKKVNRYVGALR